jgi:hypothetical protein
MFDDSKPGFCCDALPDDIAAEMNARIDQHFPPPTEEEIDAMYIAAMECHDAEAASKVA